jgi:hypothetical protein
MFLLNLGDIAFELALHDSRYVPMVHRLGQDFVIVANVLQCTGAGGTGPWNEECRFYFDVIRHDRERMPLRIYSMVGSEANFAGRQLTAMRYRFGSHVAHHTGEPAGSRP